MPGGLSDHFRVHREQVSTALALFSGNAHTNEDDVKACHVIEKVGAEKTRSAQSIRFQIFHPGAGPVGILLSRTAIEYDFLAQAFIDKRQDDIPGNISESPHAYLVSFLDTLDKSAEISESLFPWLLPPIFPFFDVE